MSRGLVQRRVLEHLWYHAGDGDDAWVSIIDLAGVVYATDAPTAVELDATRCAARELEAEGLLETLVVIPGDPPRDRRRRPLRIARSPHIVLHAASTAPTRRLLSRSRERNSMVARV